ncbi:TIM-barrel domain-containing protein [Sanguibacter sp. 25GB23B1]|uniref:glycoside hydrolase family 31 protein n=1 Tax=unclassified Sanguibacter TaxID=2645534 RepID=UPI0032AFBEFB
MTHDSEHTHVEKDTYLAKLGDAEARPEAVVRGPGYRITVLTSRLVRLERHPDEAFTDLPTQTVQHRAFDVPDFTVERQDDGLDLWTEHLHVSYDGGPFTPGGLSVTLRHRAQSAHTTTWRFGDDLSPDAPGTGNLGGTARTLDEVDGACSLEPGLLATYGYSVVDDSRTALLTPDGQVRPRPTGGHDLYVFGYGLDHRAALADFFRLTGPNPLVPRFALGNWWSRFHRYSADDYLELVDRFATDGLPFSVAVLDMDWHLVDIDPTLGSGWTGYTWNPELFPDPGAFLAALHERGLAVSLNVHPADGVRRHEDAYADMARDLGRDPSDGLEIAFDITSPAFVDSYLARLHHPHEALGVDFWWLDWQSGGSTKVPGIDPLWMLNHLHYLDSGRDGRRPLTFSRYAGVGSHRYPVGFSGDTIVSWASLDFQPYFTATAANIGYHWWSHDIGGHMHGIKDDELATRWVQLGVFSPVNRLHSSSSPFNSKEPWRFDREAERIMGRYLRLRHELVPYLYTAAWASHADGVGVCRPMYHDHPRAPEAYQVPNQYLLGPDLVVAPITEPADTQTGLAAVHVWLPEGSWVDVVSGLRYEGGRTLLLHRGLEEIPVLARAGAVLPLAADPAADVSALAPALAVRLVPGADGHALLHEDDGAADVALADRHETTFTLTWRSTGAGTADATLRIDPPRGTGAPTHRAIVLDVAGASSVGHVTVRGGAGIPDDPATSVAHKPSPSGLGAAVRLDLGTLDLTAGAEVELTGVRLPVLDAGAAVFDVLDRAQVAFGIKESAYATVRHLHGRARVEALHALDLPGNLFGALLERLPDDPL